MDTESLRRSADTLAAVLGEIDSGNLDASADQRAYLSGALDTLKGLLNN